METATKTTATSRTAIKPRGPDQERRGVSVTIKRAAAAENSRKNS